MSNITVITESMTSDNAEDINKIPNFKYIEAKTDYTGARFLRECCMKVNATVPTMCIAATYYHKFFSHVSFNDYDPYLIACTSIYLASKVKNDDIKIRDIINVGYHTIHPNEAPLNLDLYFELRDSLVETELLLMRMLKFNLQVELPHKYLLHFLNALKDWIGIDVFEKFPIAETCWAVLLDSYHVALILNYSPPVIAASVICLTFQIYGVTVPGSPDITESSWLSALHPDCKLGIILQVVSEIIQSYSLEKTLKFE